MSYASNSPRGRRATPRHVGTCDDWAALSGPDLVTVRTPAGRHFVARLIEVENAPVGYELRVKSGTGSGGAVAFTLSARVGRWLSGRLKQALADV